MIAFNKPIILVSNLNTLIPGHNFYIGSSYRGRNIQAQVIARAKILRWEWPPPPSFQGEASGSPVPRERDQMGSERWWELGSKDHSVFVLHRRTLLLPWCLSAKRIYLPMQEMQLWSLGQDDPLEKEMATLSSILANPMDRGAWRATVLGVAKSWTRLTTSTPIFK